MSRSTYVQRTIRNTLISEKSFKETLDTFLYGTFYFYFRVLDGNVLTVPSRSPLLPTYPSRQDDRASHGSQGSQNLR